MPEDNIEFYKPDDKKKTSNINLIRAAYRDGFKEGIAFMNESDSMKDDIWRRNAFKKFCEKHNIKL